MRTEINADDLDAVFATAKAQIADLGEKETIAFNVEVVRPTGKKKMGFYLAVQNEERSPS